MKEGRDKRRREESDGESGGGGERGDTGVRCTGGKEAESLGGSQAALSVSVAAQSGLPSLWPRKPSLLPRTTSHPDHTALLSFSVHFILESSHTFIWICYSCKDFALDYFKPIEFEAVFHSLFIGLWHGHYMSQGDKLYVVVMRTN